MRNHLNSASIIAIVVASFVNVRAQGQAFEKGDQVAGAMIGFLGNYSGYSYNTGTPAIGLFYEKATNIDVGPGVLGLGGYFGFRHLGYSSDELYNGIHYSYDQSWTYLILGARGAYHYNDWHGSPKWDTYCGLMLHYNVVSYSDNTSYPYGAAHYSSGSYGGLALSFFLGARYFFNEKWAFNAELGYGIATLQLGAAYKF